MYIAYFRNGRDIMRINKRLKQFGVIAVIVFLVILYKKYLSGIGVEDIRIWVDGFGIFAPIAYMVLFALLPIAFFPVPVLAVAGGIVFGLLKGTVFTLIGAWLNSAIMFVMAKFFAREMVLNFLKKRLPEKWWNKFIEADDKSSFFVIFVMRLIPAIPYNVINYAAGLSGISFRNYILATMIGIFPGTLVFINIGDKASDISDPKFIISIALLVILTVVSLILAKRINSDKDVRDGDK